MNPDETHTHLLTTIELLYDSVLDQTQWTKALKAVATFVGGTGVGHFLVSSTGVVLESSALGVDPARTEEYQRYYGARDIRIPPAMNHPVGSVLTERNLVEQRDLEKSEIYNDLLLPADVPYFMFSWLQKNEVAAETIAIQSSMRRGAFERESIQRFQLLIPHLLRSLQARERLLALEESRSALLQITHALPVGVAFLHASGRVLEMSDSMLEILRRSNGFGVRRDCFFAGRPEEHQKMIKAIALAVSSNTALPGASMTVTRAPPQPRLSLTILPIRSSDRFTMSRRTAAMVLVSDPLFDSPPPLNLIADALGITGSEAALAGALCSGVSLREVSVRLGRSVNTCKAQLKSVYAKTGCRSHVDLVKLLVAATMARPRKGTSKRRA